MRVNRSGWTVGTDGLAPRDWSGEVVQMPSGRLHAVSDPGLIVGRALCLAPVNLLDPRDWRWPDDGDEEWPAVRDLPHADPRRILTAAGTTRMSAAGTNEDDTLVPGSDRAELDRTSTQRSLIAMAEASRGVRTHDRAGPRRE